MNDYSENMFFIPILHLSVRDWEIKKQELKKLFIFSNMKKTDTVLTDYHTYKNRINYDNDVKSILEEEINIFKCHFSIENCKINSSWFEVAKKYDHHECRSHGTVGYSAVCYIEYDESIHTPTRFISPFYNFIDGGSLFYEPPNIREGSLIFFPSQINHWTEPNISDNVRVVLSFNLDVS